MAVYGYARVSSADQDYALQAHALRAAGCEIIRAEKVSGTVRAGRTELELLLEFLRHGDTLVVTRVDRLARSINQSPVRQPTRSHTSQRATGPHAPGGLADLSPVSCKQCGPGADDCRPSGS
jgi:hypothetical protein